MIKQKIFENIIEAIKKAAQENKLGQLSTTEDFNFNTLSIEKTRNAEFGDFAINVSSLAKYAKLPPAKIAEAISQYINIEDISTNFIGGFINFKLGHSWLNNTVKEILEKSKTYGKNNLGNGEKVLLEYVSANPTGPLHIGHGRWAAVGSSLANLMNFSGYKVSQEFYINDAGNQINNLGRSLWLRILQLSDSSIQFPQTEEEGSKNYYPGEYLIAIAQKYTQENPDKLNEFLKEYSKPINPPTHIIKAMSDYAKAILLEEQKQLLNNFKVHFDNWYSELSIHSQGEVEKTIEKLKTLGKLFEKENATWFKSSDYGDDQDRVIIKSDNSYTYLTADIAYHYDKFKRGYDRLINIWGADHHGYVARMKAAMEALGYDSTKLEVLLGQLVNLIISGEQVRMGKRKKMLTLEELIDEVGIDATRYWMIMKSIDNTLDFDVELAKSCSDENPVYYVQYAHARAAGILRTACADRLNPDTKEVLPPFVKQEELENILANSPDETLISNLWNTKEEKELEATKALVLKLELFKDAVINAAKYRAPYQIARYAQELASDFHHFYSFTRVLNVEDSLMKARLCVVYSTKQVMANALTILGVSAPESM